MSKNMKNFSGRILFLDRSDINTDEIIPARYLTEIERKALKPYLLEDLEMEDFNPETDIAGKTIIITRDNFGCGSSREHAAWALGENGINIVIASGFARIFRQNMFNCGMLAIKLPREKIEDIFRYFRSKDSLMETSLEGRNFTFSNSVKKEVIPFEISEFDYDLIKAGGWVEYADSKY